MTHSTATWFVVLISVAACLDVAKVSPPPATKPPNGILPPQGPAARPSVSAALHLHGWSNHSASDEPASIAWHTQQYAAAGVDLVWWTDHSDVYSGHMKDFVVTPLQPSRITATLWTVGTWGNGGSRAFLVAPPGATPSVDSARSRVTVALPPGDPSRLDTIQLFFGQLNQCRAARAALVVLARPLVGDPFFAMTVWSLAHGPAFPGTDILVPLAWHPRGAEGYRQVLRYHLERGADSSVTVLGDTVDYTLPLGGLDSAVIVLRPKLDASLLPDGIDNTTDEYRIRFTARRGADSVRISFTLPTVTNGASGAANQMLSGEQIAAGMASTFGVRTIWGVEMAPSAAELKGTKWDPIAGAGRHLSVYLPGGVPATLVDPTNWTPRSLTADVLSRGGLTAIPHPFGTQGGLPTSSFQENQALVEELGSLLVQYRAWDAPLIEVGYTSRGGVGITEHLELLDYLLASGVRICGIGTTDSHGRRLVADPLPGTPEQWNFVTWIGGVTRIASDADIIDALRACNASFGNPFYVRGGMWIDLNADPQGILFLDLDVAGVSPSAQFYLFEGEIDSSGVGHWPTYRQRGAQVARTDHPRVGGCRAGFARLEAWVGTRALAFSNVAMIPPDPSRCGSN